MKLVRWGERGAERPGLIDGNGALRDLSGEIEDITPETLAPAMLDRLRGLEAEALPVVAGKPRFGVPVGVFPRSSPLARTISTTSRRWGMSRPMNQ